MLSLLTFVISSSRDHQITDEMPPNRGMSLTLAGAITFMIEKGDAIPQKAAWGWQRVLRFRCCGGS